MAAWIWIWQIPMYLQPASSMVDWAMAHPIMTFILVIVALLTIDSIGCSIGRGIAKRAGKDG